MTRVSRDNYYSELVPGHYIRFVIERLTNKMVVGFLWLHKHLNCGPNIVCKKLYIGHYLIKPIFNFLVGQLIMDCVFPVFLFNVNLSIEKR